jgi:hypothetical protein
MRQWGKSAIVFAAIGLMIYAGFYFAAEQLTYRNGHSNPLFKIMKAEAGVFDWVILGASHAMPLDFSDFNGRMQDETGLKIINLASPGTGPLYNRFILQAFLRDHSTKNVLYVVDSFAFYSRVWNEDRFVDAKLLRAMPFDRGIARLLWQFSRLEGIDPRAVADYVTGFSKINNRERFQKDVWEGELQFDRVYRPSASAVKSRINYLFPAAETPLDLARYLAQFSALLEMTKSRSIRVVAVKMPTPAQFRAQLPNETVFDHAMLDLLGSRGLALDDFSSDLEEPKFYFDTDHLNRAGVAEFFDRRLKQVLLAPPAH